MMLFEKVLNPEELNTVCDFLEEASFVDGKYSAAEYVKERKQNLQLEPGAEGEVLAHRIIIDALLRHEVFLTWARPLHLTPPIFAQYEKGMHYGAHVDAPVLGGGSPLRSDLSVTVFLSDPENYTGGELAIEIPGGVRKVKLTAGSAVVYPTQAVHQVCEVKEGQRLVSVLWVQSEIRDPHIRQTLFDLEAVTTSVSQQAPQSQETILLQKSLSNLRRHFTEI